VRSVVVVGASLAGLRAAEELRAQGFDGSITVVGDEPHRPYDRPPLSKQLLAGTWEPEQVALGATVVDDLDDLQIDWRLGWRAIDLDLGTRTILVEPTEAATAGVAASPNVSLPRPEPTCRASTRCAASTTASPSGRRSTPRPSG
jgi:NADPH-dependent 2,4-dienoyl-CoA reductase/sulfur reductase-like enzyme